MAAGAGVVVATAAGAGETGSTAIEGDKATRGAAAEAMLGPPTAGAPRLELMVGGGEVWP